MKNKIAILIFAFTLALTACGRGTSQPAYPAGPTAPYNPAAPQPAAVSAPVSRPVTPQELAELFIQNKIRDYDRPHVQIAETRIDRLEKLGEYEHPTSGTIELWAFNFSLRVEYEPFVRFSGANAQPCPQGWTHPTALLGNFVSHLVFARRGDDLTLLGPIDWSMNIGVPEAEMPWTTEMLLIQFLEHKNLLLPVTFPGNHRFVYVRMDEGGSYMRFLLSQPVTQGDGGIWTIDRWQNFTRFWSNDAFFYHPQCDTLNVAEFYAQQQRRFDAGELPHLGDPAAVVRAFLDDFIRYDTIVGVYDASGANPTARINAHGPISIQGCEHSNTEWPTDFRGDFFREYVELRERKLAELGGLAFNRAYHFRMDCGRHGLISGWRPMLTRAEFIRYFPRYDMPAQLGDFTLAGITVNDLFLDAIRVYNRPVPPVFMGRLVTLFADYEVLPVGRVFTRNLHAAEIYAVYVNSRGQYVLMGIAPSFGSDIPSLMWGMQYSRVDMGALGEFYFIGGRDRYAVAMFKNENTQQVISLGFFAPGFPTSDVLDGMMWHDFRGLRAASMEELTELIRTFDPRALFEEYGWF